MINFHLITLFPEMFSALDHSILKRAQQANLFKLNFCNPRQFSIPPHCQVDDRPYGGGPGMVMQIEPLQKAVQAAKKVCANQGPVIYLSPRGKSLNQTIIKELSAQSDLIIIAGRYEGVDERLIELEVTENYSVGDFVVSGGELPAMLLIDAVVRLLPGVLGHDQSAAQDSFSNGLLDCDHYTRPPSYQGLSVPKILLSGNHEVIRRWRLKNSLGKTWQMRKDLLKNRVLTAEEQQLLNEYVKELENKNSN